MALRADSVSLEEELYLRNPSFLHVESYISKVTTAGQLTLPKKIRKALGLGGRNLAEGALVAGRRALRRFREAEGSPKPTARMARRPAPPRQRMQYFSDT